MTYRDIERKIHSAKRFSGEMMTLVDIACELDVDLTSVMERAALAKAIVEHRLEIFVIPNKPVTLKHRFLEDYENKEIFLFGRLSYETCHNRQLDEFVGFTTKVIDEEKIIARKNFEIYDYTDTIGLDTPLRISEGKLKPIADIYFTLTKDFSSSKVEETEIKKRLQLFDVKDRSLPGHGFRFYEFYVEVADIKGKVSDEDIYVKRAEFMKKKFRLEENVSGLIDDIYSRFYPDPDNVGDYEVNEWSNGLVRDLNCALYQLRKINSDDSVRKTLKESGVSMEEVMNRWFKKRWENRKGLWKNSDKKAYEIMSDKNMKIDLDMFGVTEACKRRNQSGATDAMILIDFLAEKIFKRKVREYGSKKQFSPRFAEAVSRGHMHFGDNIYSIAKAKD